MSVFTRTKSYRIRHKERNPEEEEEFQRKHRYLEKLKAKTTLIKAEFERHKKKILFTGTETSKANEAKLRAQLNELNASNTKKMQTLSRLTEMQERVGHENQDNSEFISILTKFEAKSPNDNTHVSMDYHTNRTTFAIISKDDDPEVLGQKLAELKETYDNIERLFQFEEESETAVRNKYDELVGDNNILTHNIKELQKVSDHFDKRFVHLKEIEFAAHSKFGETIYDLNELKDITTDLKTREKAYKKDKRKLKESEEAALIAQQQHLASIMVALDEKKIENVQVEEDLKKVTIKYDQMVEKKKIVKVIAEFTEIIEKLYEFGLNPDAPRDTLKNFLEVVRETKDRISASTEEGEKGDKSSNNLIPSRERSMSRPRESLVDRNFYLEKIYKFYERHPNGPDPLIADLLELYSDLCFKEGSLKTMHDEFQREKLKKEMLLGLLMKDLRHFKAGSTRDLRSLEGSDAGIFVVNSQEFTMNQARFVIDTQKETDSELAYLSMYERFILRCYLDSMEMVARFGKLLGVISDQADMVVPSAVKKLAEEIQYHVSLLRRVKKPLKANVNAFKDIETVASMHSEREDLATSSDLSAAFQCFITRFGGFAEKATDFVNRLKLDAMIGSFIRPEDVAMYLEAYGDGPNLEDEVERALHDVPELRQKAIENLIKRFNMAFSYYSELISTLQTSKEYCFKYFDEKNHKLPTDLTVFNKQEPSEHVKNAMMKKWERMLDRYEYDPALNYYRTGHSSYSEVASMKRAQNRRAEEQVDQEINEEDSLDMDDLKGKLNDLTRQTLCQVGPRKYGDGTAFLSKTKQEEERKRLLMKQKKEEMKQVLYNMSEDEYFEWSRKQIGRGEDNLVMHLEDIQGLKRASTSHRQKTPSYVPLEGIKKMIESSKMLAKINILERNKIGSHGIKTLKYELLGNYIPPDPKVFPKSVTSSPTGKSKAQALKRLFSPSSQVRNLTNNGGQFPSSTRNTPVSEALDSTNDLRFRPSIHSTIGQQPKFKHISPSYSQTDLKHDLDTSTQNVNSQNKLLGTSLPHAAKPAYNKSQSHKMFIKAGDLETNPPTQFKQKAKLNNLLKQHPSHRQSLGEKETEHKSVRERSEPVSKEVNELPKLKKNKARKVTKQKRLSLPESFANADELCNYFSLQGDPLIKGVYSSSLFASSLPGSPTAAELQFRRALL